MGRRLLPRAWLTEEELAARYRGCADGVEKIRWQILWLHARGRAPREIADVTGYTIVHVRLIIRRYNAGGPEAVRDGRHRNPGRAPRLDIPAQAALRRALASPHPEGGPWTGPRVARWISERTGRPALPQLGWDYLRRLSAEEANDDGVVEGGERC